MSTASVTDGMTALSTIEMIANGSGMARPPMGRSQTLSTVLSYLMTAMLAVVMVGMGCAVDLDAVKKHVKRPTGIIIGFICQFGVMPAIAAMLAAIFQMPEEETLALLITGSCPGGSASNVATYWVAGDISLSVTMTTISSTLGLGMMPLLLFIYQEAYDFSLRVPFDKIGIALATLVVPIGIGIAIKWKIPKHAKMITRVLSVIGILAILTVATISIVTYGSSFSVIPGQIACAAIFPGVGMMLGYVICSLASLVPSLRLKHKERRTVCFETGIQNAQLASAVIQLSANTNLTDPLEIMMEFQRIGRMILFPVIYLLSQIVWVVISIIAFQIYQRKFVARVGSESSDDESRDEQHSKADKEMNGHVNTNYQDDLPPKYDNSNNADQPEKFDHNTQM